MNNIYSVIGFGTFPIDLLRVQQCWPHTPSASVNLSASDERRVVILEGIKLPDKHLWRSRGWTVTLGKPLESNSYVSRIPGG